MNLTQKIISEHLLEGEMIPGREIALNIDQTLTQDATGTMAYLQWEAMGLDEVRTELSVSYVDHNTMQMGYQNPDDHRYLRSVAAKYGIIFSPPGTGICHQLHLENFAKPGKTLLGSDSHTPTAGGLGSLAIGAGGLSVALAMAGEPYTLPMPKIVRIWLEGQLTGWATAKDLILYILSELTVKGGVGSVMEYAGPGAATLSVPERATITNMGAELGATSSVFPSDEKTYQFLEAMHRKQDFVPLQADQHADYDQEILIDLQQIEPMAAKPHMPDKGFLISDLDGLNVDQVAIGSCTNSSYADLKSVAQILDGRHVNPQTDVLLSPGSKQVLRLITRESSLEKIINAGARLLECTCGPCIGMGGSPPSNSLSARTFNRNFEGRSGTQDAGIYLVSPVTAAQAALKGQFTAPQKWGTPPAKVEMPKEVPDIRNLFVYPPEDRANVEVIYGPNIVPLQNFPELPSFIHAPILLKTGDNITTDHILPGGAQITALRSNIPAISEYVYSRVDPDFVTRAKQAGKGLILGGENYGQGSSREHAALAPRYLGIVAILAKSFARIHRANLINFGILPLMLTNKQDYELLKQGQNLSIPSENLLPGNTLQAETDSGHILELRNDLTAKELKIIHAGGLLNFVRKRKAENN
jgi:aconitate hydratase